MFGSNMVSNSQFCLRTTPFALLLAACSPVEATQETLPAGSSAQSESSQAQIAQAQIAQAESARHPISGLEVGPVTVVSGDRRFAFKTEFAISRQAQARGMMFRESMEDDEAMIFPNDPPAQRSFWMKNTPISLDIIFIGEDRRITNIETAVPYSLESVRSDGEVIAVFEIRGGLAAELGIAAGDRVMWELP
ncbi:MAG: DUF192 domain-containing protein [Pseudomonadota bacterium]